MAPKNRIYLSSPHMGEKEFEYVKEAFDTNWIAPVGPHVNAFETELASCVGMHHCAALSSGTAAIHLALIILNVLRGDEVICSSFTFSGSCNPIVYLGAKPVFIDSEKETWNMDPVLLEEAIVDRIKKTGKTPKAIILVHLYGMPAKIHEIIEIANRYEIPVIEDAAEALGSKVNGRSVGTFGEVSVFSFNGNKIITTSGGGALLSNNEFWIQKARFLATQARDNAPHYEHSEIGYNYRLSNVCAGIGRGQLEVLEQRIRSRRNNYEFYLTSLKDKHGVQFLPEPEGYFSNRWLTTIIFDNTDNQLVTREKVRLTLENENIESRPLWKPMHLQQIFKDYPSYISGNSESFFNSGLCLPSGSNLSKSDLERVAEIVSKV